MFKGLFTNYHLLVDCFGGASIFDSPRFAKFHKKIVAKAPERPEMQATEINAADATRKLVEKLYNQGPLVIRGAIKDSTSVRCWHDPDWWLGSYQNEKVLCTSPKVTGGFTLDEFIHSNQSLYVQGATALFEHRPELKDMVESDVTRLIAPGKEGEPPLYYQLFMGWKNQGSTVHCAIGLNVFRQIAGRKRWYFFPPSQTPYMYPKVYENGFSATSKTVQHHAAGTGSPWFGKLERYTTVLEPGDVLVVPPWWWHCVENEAGADELVIGVATRYKEPRAALRTDPFKTLISMFKARGGLAKAGGDDFTSLEAAVAFEEKLMRNRNETEQMLTLHASVKPDSAEESKAGAAP